MQDTKRWIWPFELIEKIGEGGMGEVYRARFVKDDRIVAVKILPPDVDDPGILARFERETEVLRKLRHPNIVHSFGGACKNESRFYAMELIEGGTLEDLLKQRGAFPWELAVEYALQMAEALAYAHERGVFHRDVKPGNFLIGPKGALKLSDFGLATMAAARRITAAGKTMGTIRYMAPEQISGKEIGPHTDLYALGCVLFQMLTGRTPFDGVTQAETLQQHLEQPPARVAAEAPSVPASLDVLVSDLLEKDPLNRPQSAVDVIRRLRSISPVMSVRAGVRSDGMTNRPTTSVEANAKHTSRGAAVPQAAVADTARWLQIAVAAIAVLLIWNLWMLKQRGSLVQAEQLWVDAFEQQGPVDVRTRAAESLAKIGNRHRDVDAVLADGLDDPSVGIREAAARAIGRTPGASGSSVSRLRKTQKEDESPNVRNAAGQALEEVESQSGDGSGFYHLLMTLVAIAAAAVAYWLQRRKRTSTD